MKTSEATELQLDLLVAKCEGYRLDLAPERSYAPSTDWAQGGPIIEREGICLHKYKDGSGWSATYSAQDPEQYGPTPLIAAMRCYVASKLGAEIDLPKELT